MSIVQVLKLLMRNWKQLIFIPLIMGLSIWYFTRHEKKTFTSEAMVYTGIASGYSLNGSNSADYFSTSNAFDNLLTIINSRETKEEVAISLLASHLFSPKHDLSIIGWDAYDDLQNLVPDSVKQRLKRGSLEETIMAIQLYMHGSNDNLIYTLLNSDNPFYSIKALRSITALRINSSDLIKVSYETEDAAICKHTLELLTDIFMKKHRNLREGQTSSVIAYFEREVKAAFKRLDSCEQIFLDFNKQNEIINYYEQTKAVAGEKENLYALNHSLEMERNANEKGVAKINEDLKGRIYQDIYGKEVLSSREKLADVYSSLALNDVLSKGATTLQKEQVDSLKKVSAVLERNMEGSITKLNRQYNTPKGIPTKTVLEEWSKSTLSFEESKARLTIMDKRKKEFEEEYRKFAPLGAMLTKIERQISVAEQEYLELLHGLNLARLTQQSNELTSKLTIVDPPYLPLKPNPSKRMMLIIIGGFAGFAMVAGWLLANFLLNKTLQQPIKAIKKIGAPLLGIYPLINNNEAYIKKANMRLIQQMLSKVSFEKKPNIISVISNQKGEGKSILIANWKKQLEQLRYKVQTIQWQPDVLLTYDHEVDFVLLEVPALEEVVLTKGSLPPIDTAILVCRANRIWTKIDSNLLTIFSKISNLSPMLVLNGVNLDNAEEYIGEVPKKRSFLRAIIKRLAKLEFGNQKVLFKG